MLESIQSGHHPVHFQESGYLHLNEHIEGQEYTGIYILADSHTHEYCLAYFLQQLQTQLPIEVIEIEPGEENKQVETCIQVWQALSELGADRKALIINLGGGVVTDLGGFVAATYMRGVHFINVPTTLLAMVDASVGGKTGVDLLHIKNQVGVITDPVMVLVDPTYLQTLPSEQLRSGLAEMFKHGLISDKQYWQQLCAMRSLPADALNALIHRSVYLKNEVVRVDPTEKGLRKILNFGHTIGHAIESYFLSNPDKQKLLHGEAIAIGMICEAYLSAEVCGLPKADTDQIKSVLLEYFPRPELSEEDFEPILQLMRYDKKNKGGSVRFVLLPELGKAIIDQTPSKSLIINSIRYYLN